MGPRQKILRMSMQHLSMKNFYDDFARDPSGGWSGNIFTLHLSTEGKTTHDALSPIALLTNYSRNISIDRKHESKGGKLMLSTRAVTLYPSNTEKLVARKKIRKFPDFSADLKTLFINYHYYLLIVN